MHHRQLARLLAFVALSGCGGRAVEDPPSSGGSAATGSGIDDPSPASGRSPSSSPSPPLPTHRLGDCTPGFSRIDNPDRACHWLTKAGVCFDDKEAACACICPLSGDSVCFSGFDDGPSSATLVQCL